MLKDKCLHEAYNGIPLQDSNLVNFYGDTHAFRHNIASKHVLIEKNITHYIATDVDYALNIKEAPVAGESLALKRGDIVKFHDHLTIVLDALRAEVWDMKEYGGKKPCRTFIYYEIGDLNSKETEFIGGINLYPLEKIIKTLKNEIKTRNSKIQKYLNTSAELEKMHL